MNLRKAIAYLFSLILNLDKTSTVIASSYYKFKESDCVKRFILYNGIL